MKVFVAGATGVLGRRLIQQLNAGGHQAVGLVRSRDGERTVESLGGTARSGDLFDAETLVHAAEGCEVVIHAATAIATKLRPRLSDWEMNDRIRRDGTRALAECAAQIGARQFLFQSIAWLARPADDRPFDEDAPPTCDRVTQSALDGERIAQEAAARHGYAAGVLRCGMFYDTEAAHTRMIVDGLRRGRLPIIGSGETVWCMLHAIDAAAAFVATAESGQSGLWHVVDDRPVSVNELFAFLAARLGVKPPRHVPIWLARLLAGRTAVEFFTRSMRTTAARFKSDVGWQPRYPTYREGFDAVVAELAESR